MGKNLRLFRTKSHGHPPGNLGFKSVAKKCINMQNETYAYGNQDDTGNKVNKKVRPCHPAFDLRRLLYPYSMKILHTPEPEYKEDSRQ
jgi:hypothetical protein